MDDATFQKIARALSDPHRLTVLEMLTQCSRLNCGAMVEQLHLAQATVSHHIKELVLAGLLTVEQEGQFNYYTVRRDMVDAYTSELRRRFLPDEKK